MGEEYIYNADVYCAACAAEIKEQITREGGRPRNPDDEYTYDSDDWPKGPFTDEESDCPQHCGSGEKCLDPHTFPSGYVAGKFLENPLTTHGREYVLESHREEPSEVTTMWVEFYELGSELETEDADWTHVDTSTD